MKEMNIFKKSILIILIIFLSFVIIGCRDDDENEEGNNNQPEENPVLTIDEEILKYDEANQVVYSEKVNEKILDFYIAGELKFDDNVVTDYENEADRESVEGFIKILEGSKLSEEKVLTLIDLAIDFIGNIPEELLEGNTSSENTKYIIDFAMDAIEIIGKDFLGRIMWSSIIYNFESYEDSSNTYDTIIKEIKTQEKLYVMLGKMVYLEIQVLDEYFYNSEETDLSNILSSLLGENVALNNQEIIKIIQKFGESMKELQCSQETYEAILTELANTDFTYLYYLLGLNVDFSLLKGYIKQLSQTITFIYDFTINMFATITEDDLVFLQKYSDVYTKSGDITPVLILAFNVLNRTFDEGGESLLAQTDIFVKFISEFINDNLFVDWVPSTTEVTFSDCFEVLKDNIDKLSYDEYDKGNITVDVLNELLENEVVSEYIDTYFGFLGDISLSLTESFISGYNGVIDISVSVANSIQASILENYLDGFNQKYNNKVNVTITTDGNYDDIYQNNITKYSTSTNPNISITRITSDLPSYYNENILIDINDYFTNDDSFSIDSYLNNYLDNCTINGSIYALPYYRSTDMLFYNKKVFDEMGYSVPATWDAFATITSNIISDLENDRILSLSDINKNDFYPLLLDSAQNTFLTIKSQWQGSYTLGDTSVSSIDANMTEGTNFFKTCFDNKYLQLSENLGASYSTSYFASEQCLMYIGSSASLSYLQDVDFEIGVAPIPYNNVDYKYVPTSQLGFVIFDSSDIYENYASYLFLKYISLTSLDYEESIYYGYYPVTINVANDLTFGIMYGQVYRELNSAFRQSVLVKNKYDTGYKVIVEESYIGSDAERIYLGEYIKDLLK